MTGADKDPGPEPLANREVLGALEDEDEIHSEMSPVVLDAVGRALQSHFQAIADLPLPDRFMVLLAELEARERLS